ncbi:hypothetical protein GA0061101_1621, partial [Rhizobium lusitanum]
MENQCDFLEVVGDESPQDNRKNNSLTVSETSKKVEAFQSFV